MEPSTPLRISASAIGAYKSCNFRYALDYVEKLPKADRAPAPSLAYGTAIHQAIARFFRCGGWARMTLDDAIAGLMASWDSSAYRDDEASLARFVAAREALEVFFYLRYPANVSRELEIEAFVSAGAGDNVIAAGRFDRTCLTTDNKLLVVDWKTGRRPLDPDHHRGELQSVFYSLLAADRYQRAGHDGVVVAYAYLDGGAPATVTLAPDEVADAWAAVEDVVHAIRRDRRFHSRGLPLEEAFRPSPGALCAWCPMWLHCEEIGVLKEVVVRDQAGL